GMAHRIVWRVGSEEALDFWAARLGAGRTGDSVLFADPKGLGHELVVNATRDTPLVAVHPEIPPKLALQGFEGVRAYSLRPEATAALLEQLMGATKRGDATWELRGSDRGGWIALDPAPSEHGRPSAGVVHHVAWSTTDA